MWITTSHKPSMEIQDEAKKWATKLGAQIVKRGSYSIKTVMKQNNMDRLVVITKDGPQLYSNTEEKPFFFHPGLSLLRIKGIMKGDNDVMVETAELRRGDSFLDCSLGLAGDAIVAAYIVGESGKVVGLESEKLIMELVKYGLANWTEDLPEFNAAMKRIEVIHQSHLEYLKSLPSSSFDVVYFDPMFRAPVSESVGISSLRGFANMSALTEEAVTHALRVCRRKVMMKERKDSQEFKRLGFQALERPYASITYGVIDK